jgi:hypothetical protein
LAELGLKFGAIFGTVRLQVERVDFNALVRPVIIPENAV